MISDAVFGGAPSLAGARTPGSTRIDARDLFSLVALAATFTAVLGIFAVSPIALEARGIPYIDSGGGVLSKFHPATPLALMAFILRCLAARRPIHAAWRLLTDDAGVLLLLAGIVVAGVFAVLVDKTPVTPLVDTFVLPILVFLLLRDLDRRAATLLAMLLGVVLIANAGLAILELLRGFHLIQVPIQANVSVDPTKANAVFSWKAEVALDWRPEALLGHPLVNGLIVGSLTICLAAPGAAWIPLSVRLPLLVLQGLALLTFGARTALVLTVLFCGWLVTVQLAEAIGRGARFSLRQVAPALVVVCLVAGLAVLVVSSGLVDRTLDRFTHDSGSATTRMTMFALIDPIPLTELVLHPDKDLVATLQRIYGLEFGIESSWIGLVLVYGLVVAAILTAGLLAFWRSVLRVAGRGGILVCLFYLIQISVTASLSGKTTTLAMVVALVVLFLRKDAAPPYGRAVSMESRAHGVA